MRGRKPVVKPMGDVVDLPTSAVRVPSSPEHFSEREMACWYKAATTLVAKNIYDIDCEDTLEAYCVQRARWQEAEEMIKKEGFTQEKVGGGDTVGTWITVSNMAHDRMVRLAGDLGLTPVARNRVVKSRGVTKSKASKFLKTG